MNPFDEENEGELPGAEQSPAERELRPDAPAEPSVQTFETDENFSSASDVPQETLRAFVACVIYANAALLLVALGPLVWIFEGWTRGGPVLLVGGILAGIRTYQTYREWKQERADADGMDADETDADGMDADETDADEADADETDEAEPPADAEDGPDDGPNEERDTGDAGEMRHNPPEG